MIFQIVKELEAKKHFLYIDKRHNSVVNCRNLSPITIPSETLLVQMHMQNLNEIRL